MSQPVIDVPKLRFSEPRRNLPGRKGVATAEDRFTIAFARAYVEQACRIHRGGTRTDLVFAREIPVNGYGIADLLVVAWDALPREAFPSVEAFVRTARPCARAFECKLADWRRAMSQASRYRYFAHQPIVVLPTRAVKHALPYLDTFKKIRVGLWSFDMTTGRISATFTPRAVQPISDRYYVHSVARVHKATGKALPIR